MVLLGPKVHLTASSLVEWDIELLLEAHDQQKVLQALMIWTCCY
jgi:hypothetical protein